MSTATMPATDRQRKLIDVLRIQLAMTEAEVNDLATSHGAPMDTLTRKAASAVITDLQRVRQERRDRGVHELWRRGR